MMDQVDRIMAVMQAAFDPFFGEAWNRRQVSDALMMPTTHAQVIDADGVLGGDGTPAGFTISRTAADEEELLLIAVRADMRGRGLASALLNALFMSAAERGIAKVFLEMRSSNPARRLYGIHGFLPIGERRNYYRMGDGSQCDAITFMKPIGDQAQ